MEHFSGEDMSDHHVTENKAQGIFLCSSGPAGHCLQGPEATGHAL